MWLWLLLSIGIFGQLLPLQFLLLNLRRRPIRVFGLHLLHVLVLQIVEPDHLRLVLRAQLNCAACWLIWQDC